jgi:uncharacterized membrane protein YhhN
MLSGVPTTAWWLLTGAAAAVDWWAVATSRTRVERVAKPATLVLLIATAIALGAADHAAGRWLLLALVFGLAGDVLLLGDTTARFRAGLAAFLLGHLAYAWCFVGLGLGPAWLLLPGVVTAGLALSAARHVVGAAHRDGGAALAGPVVAYMLVISVMTLVAWLTGRPAVAVGATVFVVSDTVLALNRFVRPLAWAPVTVMVTYHVGQALIVWGVLAAV